MHARTNAQTHARTNAISYTSSRIHIHTYTLYPAHLLSACTHRLHCARSTKDYPVGVRVTARVRDTCRVRFRVRV